MSKKNSRPQKTSSRAHVEAVPESPTVALASLGCAKNLVESEVLLADLATAGFILTADASDADAIVVNTCGFLQSAQAEAAETIEQLQQYKNPRFGRCRCLVVAGCWAQIAADEIFKRFTGVDLVIGVNNRADMAESILKILHAPKRTTLTSAVVGAMADEATRFRLTPEHWAYLRISEGCSQGCSFCSIPIIRGRYRSKASEQALREARQLIESGAEEIVLIGQETTIYGHDFDRKYGLADLLAELNELPGLDWLRLMYTYPGSFDDRTIDALATLPTMVKYIDMPLQHINDRVLKHMRRKNTGDDVRRLLTKLRERVPTLALRTTVIVGYPTETEAEFTELLEFVREFEFDALGAFAYSPEPGTLAAKDPNQIADEVKQDRLHRIMSLQKDIARKKSAARVGTTFEVRIEPEKRNGCLVTRHSQQAPEVDPVTLVKLPHRCPLSTLPGDKLTVKCTGVRGYDLLAEPVIDSAEASGRRRRK